MPKASSVGKVSSSKDRNKSEPCYWMYKDGHSYWGIGIMRNTEVPLKITKEMHANENQDEKIQWHKEETAKIVEAIKAKASKEAKKK